MIIRTAHDKNNPYYMKGRDCVNNKSLSWKAKGIHDYLMSKPDQWEISISNLINASSDGEAATRAGVNELIEAGYMVRVRVTDEKGKVTGWELHAYESVQNPDCENHNVDNPDCGFPDVGFPHVENQVQVNKEYKENKEKEESKSFSAKKRKPTAKAQQPTVPEKEAGVTGDAIPSPNSAAPLPTEQQRKFQLLCNIVGWDYKTLTKEQQGQVAQTLGILTKAGYTEENLSQFFDKVWSKDWRWQNHRSYPTLSQVRAEIGKLRAAPDTVPVVVAPVVTAAETPKLAPYLRMQHRKGYYTQ